MLPNHYNTCCTKLSSQTHCLWLWSEWIPSSCVNTSSLLLIVFWLHWEMRRSTTLQTHLTLWTQIPSHHKQRLGHQHFVSTSNCILVSLGWQFGQPIAAFGTVPNSGLVTSFHLHSCSPGQKPTCNSSQLASCSSCNCQRYLRHTGVQFIRKGF